MRSWFVALGLWGCAAVVGISVFAPPAAAAGELAKTFSPALISEIDRCLQRIEQRYQDDPEFEFQIQKHCRSLTLKLAQENVSAYLQQPLDNSLTVDELMDLKSIASTINATTSNNTATDFHFDVQGLAHILDNTLVLEPEKDVSWWQQFLNWLAEFFEHNETQQPQWLKDWLSQLSIPAWFVEAFYKGMVILLVILLLAIVVVEVRAAGVSNWFKRRSQRLRLSKSESHAGQEVLLTWEAIMQLPAREKILTAYSKLLHVLANRDLIPRDSSLTNYEIQSRLETALGGEQPVFRQLVRSVETTLYGDKTTDPQSLDNAVRGAEQFAEALPAQQTNH
jgi:hypothetical protein